MHPAVQTTSSAIRNWRIRVMLASAQLAACVQAQDPPTDLVKRVAAAENAAQQAQSNYTYRQSVTVEELDNHGTIAGEYHELRDIIFSPSEKRTEHMIGTPRKSLKRLQLT